LDSNLKMLDMESCGYTHKNLDAKVQKIECCVHKGEWAEIFRHEKRLGRLSAELVHVFSGTGLLLLELRTRSHTVVFAVPICFTAAVGRFRAWQPFPGAAARKDLSLFSGMNFPVDRNRALRAEMQPVKPTFSLFVAV
jgi:hypothetical protein